MLGTRNGDWQRPVRESSNAWLIEERSPPRRSNMKATEF
jgi:hypothetical protein